MATINEIARERRQAFRQLLRELRDVDSALEKAERYAKRVLARKRDVPTTQDLEKWIDLTRVMFSQFDGVAKSTDAAAKVFF